MGGESVSSKKKRLSKEDRNRLIGETHRKRDSEDAAARREELLRPSSSLGYDHAQIALHLLEREAYAIAESELRRAIWLNPYESAFQLSLAFCLYRQKRFAEAKDLLATLPECGSHDQERKELLGLVEGKLGR
jgi:thioredoxin-like negative regulator of GroEL